MTKNLYVSDVVGDDYHYWGSGKIFIEAPTGCGKSSFIVNNLQERYRKRGLKLLILCNRRLLRLQYWYELARKFERYAEFRETVDVKTYQQLATLLAQGEDMEKVLRPYTGLCLDECHFFYSDSDFNGFGTHVLLQELIRAGLEKQLIFMSATLGCVKPLAEQILDRFRIPYPKNREEEIRQEIFLKVKEYRIQREGLFDHIRCLCVPDIESLCARIGQGEGKSVVFFDNKEAGEQISQLLREKFSFKAKDIALLNAQNLDGAENSDVVQYLCLAHKVLPRVLITTSVLDNGVSIHDPQIENVAIITDSRVSFLQMLGRMRRESSKHLNLYFLERPASYFAGRERELSELSAMFRQPDRATLRKLQLGILCELWNRNSELAENYRKVYVPIPRGFEDIFGRTSRFDQISRAESVLAVNVFAKEKIGDLYLQVAAFHSMAMEDPKDVIYRQMEWIGKSASELEVVESSVEAEQREELFDYLLTIKDCDVQQLGQKKEDLSKRFGKGILRDIAPKNRSFATEKLAKLAESYGLRLRKEEKEGKSYYSISKEGN